MIRIFKLCIPEQRITDLKELSTNGKIKKCIVIVGPTAVGKTALAVELASYFDTEIISADSRQCFKELSIGVARPSKQELSLIKHHFIASHSIHEVVNAAVFEEYALQKINTIFTKKDVAIMVGGTGLYIKSFCEGMDEVPEVDPVIRNTIVKNYNNNGIEWLRDQVQRHDKAYYIRGEILNPQRMMRALEVKLSTNRSILHYQTKQKKQRPFDVIKIGIELPRPTLTERINKRVDIMIDEGLTDEVKSMLPFRHLNALQTVGYKEIFDYLNGSATLIEAVEAIKISTRQYAKRQMTWFKKDAEINWCEPDIQEVIHQLKKSL